MRAGGLYGQRTLRACHALLAFSSLCLGDRAIVSASIRRSVHPPVVLRFSASASRYRGPHISAHAWHHQWIICRIYSLNLLWHRLTSSSLSSSSKSLRDRAAAQLGGRPACSRRLVAAPRAAKAKSAACRRTTGSCSSRLVADASRLSGARISARGRRRWAPLKLVLPGERGPTRACALCSAAMREFNNSFFIARSTEHRAPRPALMYTPLLARFSPKTSVKIGRKGHGNLEKGHQQKHSPVVRP